MNGAMSTVWYDRKKITPTVPECADTVEDACIEVGKIIKQEIDSGIPKNKIAIGNIHFFLLKSAFFSCCKNVFNHRPSSK